MVAQTLDRELRGVESVCNDTSVLERNLLQKISMSPDYCAMECEAALADLRTRIAQYESQYETLTTHERLSFIKLFDLSSELHLNLIYGSVARLVPYMMGIHIGRRPIWLVRAAHCEDAGDGGTPNSSGEPSESAFPSRRQGSQTVIVPRAAALSEEGLLFAQRLGAFVRARCVEHHVASDATLTQQREAPPATAGAGTADSMRPESTVSSVDAMSESGCVIYSRRCRAPSRPPPSCRGSRGRTQPLRSTRSTAASRTVSPRRPSQPAWPRTTRAGEPTFGTRASPVASPTRI